MTTLTGALQAAEILWEAAQTHTPCGPVRDLLEEGGLDAAYEAQRINSVRRIERGGQKVGSKIGLTSEAVQKQLGVDQPDYGIMYADMAVANGDGLSMAHVMQPKAEAEITFVLKKALEGENLTIEQVAAAIDYGVASIEIAGSRIADWNIRITDTIADNASASHYVLGDNRVALADIDLTGCKMTLEKNGEVVSSGNGAACLGNPLNAVLWLAQTMVRLGQPLQAGDIVLSGALGPMVNVEEGDFITATIEGLGSASVFFTE